MAQKKKIMTILFSIVFIFLLTLAKGEEGLNLEGLQGTDKIEYKSENLRDPFQEERVETEKEKAKRLEEENPLFEERIPIEIKPLPPLEIQGITWGSSLPQAIINNKVLKIGDTIEEVLIKDISKGKVTVFFGNQEYNLSTSPAIN